MILVAAAVVILWIVATVVWVADASTARQAIDSILLNDGFDADGYDRPEGSSRRVEDAVSPPRDHPRLTCRLMRLGPGPRSASVPDAVFAPSGPSAQHQDGFRPPPER